MTEQFKWVDYYEEFASKLLEYRNNRKELIDIIVKVYDSIEMKLPKLEANGIPEDIDPFTIFGLFNKGITNDNRISILEGIAKEFSISSEVPHDFDGIPVLNNMMATFYAFEGDERKMIVTFRTCGLFLRVLLSLQSKMTLRIEQLLQMHMIRHLRSLVLNGILQWHCIGLDHMRL